MLKTLIKKELRRNTTLLFFSRKNGKKRSVGSALLYALLLIYAFGIFGWLFYSMSKSLCLATVESGQSWLCFAIMSSTALLFGLLLSVLSIYTGLYQGKDNELLFSLPIPPKYILLSRLTNCYLTGMLGLALILIPTFVAYGSIFGFSGAGAISSLLLFFLLGLLILSLSCIVGWVIALIASHVRNKNFIIVVVSLLGIFLYIFLYNKATLWFESIAEHIGSISSWVLSDMYPLYRLGRAFEGDAASLLMISLSILALSAVVFFLLNHNLTQLTFSHKSKNRKIYKEKASVAKGLGKALLLKEGKLLLQNPTYLLNCSMGSVFGIVAAVFLLINPNGITEKITDLSSPQTMALLVGIAIAYTTIINSLSAYSISMEGKHFYMLRSLPIPTQEILKAKLRLHLLFTLIPAFLLWISAVIMLKVPAVGAVLSLLFIGLTVLFSATLGLKSDIRHPKLEWNNATEVIKQNIRGLLVTCIESGIMLILFVPCIVIISSYNQSYFASNLYLCIICALMGFLDYLEIGWLKNKGKQYFEAL